MALTDTSIKNTKATEKTQKLFDGDGLYLEVTPKGSKRWRFKYRFKGKEKLLSVGLYPEISLKVARDRRDDLRRQVVEGVDPSAHRQALKGAHIENAANTFEVIGREWHLKFSSSWMNIGVRSIFFLNKFVYDFPMPLVLSKTRTASKVSPLT